MKFFIIHGAYGNPQENWFPWLKKELEKLGHTVFVPEFSTPENQKLDVWLNEFGSYYHLINEDSILIGHSLAPAFILSVLEKLKLPKPMKVCFFVAGFVGDPLGAPEVDEINKTFTQKEFNWDKIKSNCSSFKLYASDNDPYVPFNRTKELADFLGGELIKIEGAGHFNKDAKYTEFPKLLENIKNSIIL